MPISHAHLRSFHAVATHGSFTRAAEFLHVSQPTLSGQVKELEERYGVKLFLRQRRRIELTELGRSVYEVTRKIFKHEEAVEQIFLSAKKLTTGELHVGADSPFIITPILAQFQRRYPGVKISIQYGNSEQVMNWLESQQCDIAVLPNVPDDKKLKIIPLAPDQLVAFVSKDHAWGNKTAIKLKSMATQRVILREKGSRTRQIFENSLRENKIKLPDVMEISGREGVTEAVAAGFGVGVVCNNELDTGSRFHKLEFNDVHLTNTEFIVCLKDSRSAQVTNAFLEMIG